MNPWQLFERPAQRASTGTPAAPARVRSAWRDIWAGRRPRAAAPPLPETAFADTEPLVLTLQTPTPCGRRPAAGRDGLAHAGGLGT